MICQRCGMTAQGDPCRNCELMEHLDDRHGFPADHIEEGNAGNAELRVTVGLASELRDRLVRLPEDWASPNRAAVPDGIRRISRTTFDGER